VRRADVAITESLEEPMNSAVCDRIKAGDVIETMRDGELISALVLLVTDEAVILDPCDDSTPTVVARDELIVCRVFNAEMI
jgi:hypothetical protein